jgi:hypothetical protein
MAVTETARPARGHEPWQWPTYTTRNMKTTIAAILWTLHDLGGELHDTSGRCLSRLRDECAERGMPVHPKHRAGSGLTQILKELDRGRFAGTIERVGASKRTFVIRLLLAEDELPARPVPVKTYNVAALDSTASVFAVKAPVDAPAAGWSGGEPDAPEPETPEPEVPEADTEDDIEDEVIEDEKVETVVLGPVELVEPNIPPLAVVPTSTGHPIDALLAIQELSIQAILQLSRTPDAPAPVDDSELDAIRTRLADTLTENNTLRRKVNAHLETIRAKEADLVNMRKALALANNNLAAIREAGNRPNLESNLRNLRQVEKLMTAPPQGR